MMNISVAGPSSKVGSAQLSESTFKRKRRVFQKDLQHMMYGCGDDPNPLSEAVALVEDIVVDYVTNMDMPKHNRCKQLLSMNEELKQARKAFVPLRLTKRIWQQSSDEEE